MGENEVEVTEEVVESGQPDDTQAPETPAEGGEGGNEYQMPEKFKGKTAEDIAKSYGELEQKLGKGDKSVAEIREIKQGLAELKQAMLKKDEGGDLTDDDETRKAQKEYLKGMGMATKEDVESAYERGRRENEMSSIVSGLEKRYDGKDGRPKFDRKDIADYAVENKLETLPPEAVYKLKHEKELIDWHIKQAREGNAAPSVPEGGKKPAGAPKKDKGLVGLTEDERIAKMKAKIEAQQG